jgi:signal transduction histidine kinase/DNA-binding NarL/FixJ family response regulator/HPt (histidine-containing phosphotransfer) domain-containing protein
VGVTRRDGLIDAALMAGFAALTAASVTHPATAPGAFWPANGVLAVLMLRLLIRRGGASIAAAAVVAAGANFAISITIGHRILYHAIAGPVMNVGEAVTAAWLLSMVCGRQPDFTNLRNLVRFAVLCVLPAVGAIVALYGVVSGLVGYPQSGPGAMAGFFGDSLGVLMTAPLLLTVLDWREADLFQRSWLERLGLFALLMVAQGLLFSQASVPALFLVFPFLMAISFRLGPVAAAYAVMASGTIAFIATITGFGPLQGLHSASPTGSLLLQIFVLATLCTALPSAGAVAEQIRLRKQLLVREAQAVAATEEALRAAAAKSDFLSTMSHELRTPLTSIFGFSQLLAAQKGLGEEARRRVELIQDSTRALLTVVNDILDYSKIEAGKFELAPQAFNLEACARSSVHMVREQAEKKGLAITRTIAPEAARWFYGDDSRLRQVLLNFLNNAIKFTAQGAIDLQVSVVDAGAEDARLRFVVQDSGVGVSPDKLDRLFKRFSQVDGSVARNYGGTGLGLAICKQLVELMGGEIGVDSVEGQGSAFWFEIPLAYAVAEDEEVLQSSDTPLNARVLVVDDIAVNREIARLMLAEAGCQIAEADSGAAAIAMLQGQVFDIVLMDLQMPGMDGIAATQEIRAMEGPASRTPIVAMTANVLPEQVKLCLLAGMNGHLGKPFKQDELIGAVRAFAAARPEIISKTGTTAREPEPAPTLQLAAPAAPDATLKAEAPLIFDPARLAELGAGPGTAVRRSLLTSLRTLLDDAYVIDPSDAASRRAMAQDAHSLVSATGSLGFMALSTASRTLQHACKDPQGEVVDALAEARRLLGESRNRLALLESDENSAGSQLAPMADAAGAR